MPFTAEIEPDTRYCTRVRTRATERVVSARGAAGDPTVEGEGKKAALYCCHLILPAIVPEATPEITIYSIFNRGWC